MPHDNPQQPHPPNDSNPPNSRRSKASWSTFAYESILAFDTKHDIQFLDMVQLGDKHACFAALIAQSIMGHIKIYAKTVDQFFQIQYNGYTHKLTVRLDEHTLIDMEIKSPEENDHQ